MGAQMVDFLYTCRQISLWIYGIQEWLDPVFMKES